MSPKDNNMLKKDDTPRGFTCYTFTDRYGMKCSVQDSSIATEACIWLGISDPATEAKIMARDAADKGLDHLLAPPSDPGRFTGWVKFPIPQEVQIPGRMHLTQQQVQNLLPLLVHFAKTGNLP